MVSEFQVLYDNCIHEKLGKTDYLDKILGRTYSKKTHDFCFYKIFKTLFNQNQKYDEKYSFHQLICCTEFFSALFSFLNLIMHIVFFGLIYPKIAKSCLRNDLIIQFIVTCVLWVSSTLFHLNDNGFTKTLDCFFSLLFIIVLNYTTFKRILLVHFKRRKTQIISYFFLVVGMTFYIYHIVHMLIDFDYLYSRAISLVLLAIWFLMSFLQILFERPEFNYKVYGVYLFFASIAAVIEFSDFPPWKFFIDSHAVWHGITAFLVPLHYVFLYSDISHHRYIPD